MKLKITTDAYQSIVKKIGSQQAEKGGILIGKDGVVTDFIFDENAHTTGSTYSLNVAYLNPMIKKLKQEGKHLMGIIHSHPSGCPELSNPDKEYFTNQFKNFPDLDFMYTPIVFSAKQGEFHIFPYAFHKNGKVETAELEILPNNYEEYMKGAKEPEPAPTIQREELLIVIHHEAPTPTIENERKYISALLMYGLLSVSCVFMLGMCLITFFHIIKNI